jgi:hypothetical protein
MPFCGCLFIQLLNDLWTGILSILFVDSFWGQFSVFRRFRLLNLNTSRVRFRRHFTHLHFAFGSKAKAVWIGCEFTSTFINSDNYGTSPLRRHFLICQTEVAQWFRFHLLEDKWGNFTNCCRLISNYLYFVALNFGIQYTLCFHFFIWRLRVILWVIKWILNLGLQLFI